MSTTITVGDFTIKTTDQAVIDRIISAAMGRVNSGGAVPQYNEPEMIAKVEAKSGGAVRVQAKCGHWVERNSARGRKPEKCDGCKQGNSTENKSNSGGGYSGVRRRRTAATDPKVIAAQIRRVAGYLFANGRISNSEARKALNIAKNSVDVGQLNEMKSALYAKMDKSDWSAYREFIARPKH